jgi:large subunit ribosomal protein L15
VGQGPGSGRGKTATRGQNGQRSRSGGSLRPGFEGGQMPLIRRLPKRGFNNARHATVYIPVNVGALQQFAEGTEVTEELLRQKGLANGRADGVKLLGRGDLDRKLTVKVHAFSASAREKIEQAGGVCEVVTRGKAK